MNYKDVLEKQIELLVEAQDDLRGKPGHGEDITDISKQIQSLTEYIIDSPILSKK